jgi:phage terminase large subunit-like protein
LPRKRKPPPETEPVNDEDRDFPETRAGKNIKWCQTRLFIPEGKNVGQELKMADFMKDDFRAIYNNESGPTRRAIISRGRKNAKTMEAACIILLHLCGREAKYRVNSQLYSTALSRDQASLVFGLACKMVRMNPDLAGAVVIRETAKQIACPKLGTTYRALSADAGTNFGLSPALVIHDELGQVRGPRSSLYEALETATAAQEEPLTIIISTQAPTDSDLLSVLIDDAMAGHDPATVLRLHTAPKDLNPFDEETIKLANPALDVFMNKKEVKAMAEDARRMPARQAEYENLVLNRRVETANPFVSTLAWKDCGGDVADLHGVPLYGGLDLSSVADLTALVLIGQIEKTWHVKPTFWLPEIGLREKAQKDKAPYDIWHHKGFLETTPGNTVSYEYVAKLLFGMFQEYNIRKIGFDRWNFKHLKPWLLHAGFDDYTITEHFVEFGQGTQSMSPALRDLEQKIKEKEIAHGMHPVLNMCAVCAVVDGKDDANRKLSKNKSTGRIDGLVALAMAIGVAPLEAAIDIEALIG